MSLSQNIIENVMRWKVLPLQSLFQIEKGGNYKSFITAMHRLRKQGLIETLPMGTVRGDKVAFPTKKLLKQLKDENTLDIQEIQLTHDSLVALTCLSMMKFECFVDADIEDRLRGVKRFRGFENHYPDAILIGRKKKEFFEVPLELEQTQKSYQRILNKIINYLESSDYKKVIFAFTSERLMLHYYNIAFSYFREKFPDMGKRLIFATAPTTDYIDMNLHHMQVIHEDKRMTVSDVGFISQGFFNN